MKSERKRNPAKTVPIPKHLKAELAEREAELAAAAEAERQAAARHREAAEAKHRAVAAIQRAIKEGDADLPSIGCAGQRLVIVSRTPEGIVTRPVGRDTPKTRWKFVDWRKAFCGPRPGPWSPSLEIPLADVDAVFPLTEVSDG